jgi:hypothetical protein
VTDLTGGETWPWKIAVLLLALVAANLVTRLINRALRAAWWRRSRRLDGNLAGDLDRIKQGQTVLTLLESAVRYLAYGVTLVVGLAWVLDGTVSALFGASFVIVLAGFSAQRLLGDVVAGGLLVFEGGYAVGDVVKLHMTDTTIGVVEEISLRTTTIRTFPGDRLTVLNGSVTGFTRFEHGWHELRLVVHGSGAGSVRDAVDVAVRRVGSWSELPFLSPPSLESVTPGDDDPDLVRAIVRAVVPPSQEWLVTELLREQVVAELGTRIVGGVSILDAAPAAVATWRAAVLDAPAPAVAGADD